MEIWSVVIVGIALLVIYITHWVYGWNNPKCNGKLPPGSMGFPVIGETFRFLSPNSSFDLLPFVKKRTQRYAQDLAFYFLLCSFSFSLPLSPLLFNCDSPLPFVGFIASPPPIQSVVFQFGILLNMWCYIGGGMWEDPRRDIGYTHDLCVDGHKYIINNVDGDQFYFHGLLDFAFSIMSEMNAAFQPGVVLDVMTLYLGSKFLVRNDTDLLKMWKMSDIESLWDVHFYIKQRDEVPLGIVDPIDLDAIPEVLLIDSDDDAPIEEIANQVEPIVEPIVYNIQAQRPKKLVTKPRLKKKKTLLKLIDEEDVEQVQVEVQVPERVQDQEQV
ncbi:hypothetical protein GIB67_024717 [Kingdonia uniflora]|uniref:Cytochrome P450 n=1 Tax=Kingdonia uniflora TaxID=39325 RepID=A0A7J7NA37_9MAGN|nr:hypothetical protein GIB67_024717 [Kingdonia uniflora]